MVTASVAVQRQSGWCDPKSAPSVAAGAFSTPPPLGLNFWSALVSTCILTISRTLLCSVERISVNHTIKTLVEVSTTAPRFLAAKPTTNSASPFNFFLQEYLEDNPSKKRPDEDIQEQDEKNKITKDMVCCLARGFVSLFTFVEQSFIKRLHHLPSFRSIHLRGGGLATATTARSTTARSTRTTRTRTTQCWAIPSGPYTHTYSSSTPPKLLSHRLLACFYSPITCRACLQPAAQGLHGG